MENLKVLVVDSSETFGLLMSSVLDKYEVKVVSSVRKGLKIFREISFDLVIIADKLSWKKFVDKIRQLNPEIKIMMTTEKADNDFCKEVIENGVGINAFLNRNKVLETLGTRLEKIFGMKFELTER